MLVIKLKSRASSTYEQKIEDPQNFFNESYRPKVELNRDITVSLGGTWQLEIFDLKITLVSSVILHG